MASIDTTTRDHTDTARLDTPELVRQLISHLGPTLVAGLAGVQDSKLPYRWAKLDGPTPRPDSYERLQTAHRAWKAISNADSDNVARAWFIGLNPRLGEEAPWRALREGRTTDVMQAAKAFVEGLDE